jgi:hypothetical protein
VGLLKTGLKAAVAVKTADVIHERVLARQQAHATAGGHPMPAVAAAPAAPVAPIPAAPASASPAIGEKLEQLQPLGELHASGVLTDVEFEVQKANILSA